MYGYYHPLYARHLMHDHAAEVEALRQLLRPASDAEPTPPRLGSRLGWVLPIAFFVVGLAVLAALTVDPSAVS